MPLSDGQGRRPGKAPEKFLCRGAAVYAGKSRSGRFAAVFRLQGRKPGERKIMRFRPRHSPRFFLFGAFRPPGEAVPDMREKGKNFLMFFVGKG